MLVTPLAAQEPERAFVQVEAPAATYFVQEPLRLVWRVGVDREFFATNALQLARQRLDVPLEVRAPLPEALPLDEPLAPSARTQSLVWNGARVDARQAEDRVRDGRRFTVLEVERSCVATRAGALTIDAPVLRYAHATRFRDDLLDGRVPLDRHEVTVRGAPLVLRIEPLPAAGVPPEFGGAVGRFAVRAEASAREVDASGSIRLALTIEGEGNLQGFAAPRLLLAGWHVLGSVEASERARRTITYDLTPDDERVTQVPTIAFAFFDPTPPAGYRTVRTEPIPILVHPAPAGAASRPARPRTVRGENEIFGEKRGEGPVRMWGRPSGALFAAALLLPWLLALVLLRWSQARERARADPRGVRARGARAVFEAGARGADPGERFLEYLAARMHCERAAIIGPELADRLQGAGIAPELAQRAARFVGDQVSARYGGATASVDDAHALVSALDAAFLAHEAGP